MALKIRANSHCQDRNKGNLQGKPTENSSSSLLAREFSFHSYQSVTRKVKPYTGVQSSWNLTVTVNSFPSYLRTITNYLLGEVRGTRQNHSDHSHDSPESSKIDKSNDLDAKRSFFSC
jgi:hypothetical protein